MVKADNTAKEEKEEKDDVKMMSFPEIKRGFKDPKGNLVTYEAPLLPQKLITWIKQVGKRVKGESYDMLEIHENISSAEEMTGVGNVLGIQTKPLTAQSGIDDRVLVIFTVSDGEINNPVECIIHNSDGRPNPCPNFEDAWQTINEAQKYSKPVRIRGVYVNDGQKRRFAVSEVSVFTDWFQTKLTAKEITIFHKQCEKYKLEPIDVMKVLLFQNFYAYDHIKTAVLLYMVSPQRPQEVMNIAVITAPGEGKDFLIRKIIRKIVPIGIIEGGTATLPALLGAMSSDNLRAVDVGLFNKYNKQRIAVSEFENWSDDVWGQLLGVMANGEYVINKGQFIDKRRDAIEHTLMLGNPPESYDWKSSEKFLAVECFGKHTNKMVSRLTLVFNHASLYSEEDTDAYEIERMIMYNADSERAKEKYNLKTKTDNIDFVYDFFREYFKYVSTIMVTHDDEVADKIVEAWKDLHSQEEFNRVLKPYDDKKRDKRKFGQFYNLVYMFAKVNARDTPNEDDIIAAYELFAESLATMAETFTKDIDISGHKDKVEEIIKAVQNQPGISLRGLRKEVGMTSQKKYNEMKSFVMRLVKDGVIYSENKRLFIARNPDALSDKGGKKKRHDFTME